MNTWIEIIIEVSAILFLFYLIFYNAFIKAIGKEQAKLVTIEELTKIEQSVKEDFNKKMESLRSELAKNNINYQITLAELTKRRFDHIENLVLSIIKLQEFIKDNMFTAENEEQYYNTKKEFNRLFKETETSQKVCNLYIPEEMTQVILDAINKTHDAYFTFLKMYRTSPQKLNLVSKSDLSIQRIREKLNRENFIAYERLNTIIENFPAILNELSDEFKKEMFFKGVVK